MKGYLNILKKFRQKIPSITRNLVNFVTSSIAIPRKTQISGHFRLNTVIIYRFISKIYGHNTLIFN